MKGFCFGRRHFLQGALVAGLGATLPMGLVRGTLAHALDGTGKKLVFLFQRGGNDGLNTLIPHGDPDYNTTIRPTLYISPSEAIDTGNGFASLHPALGDLQSMLTEGELALVHRVGYAEQSRSHFDGQRIWENGDPLSPSRADGWLSRYMGTAGLAASGLIPALSCQDRAPTLLKGEGVYPNVPDPNAIGFGLEGDLRTKVRALWRSVYENPSGTHPYRDPQSRQGVRLMDSQAEIISWDNENWNPTDPLSGEYLFPVTEEQDTQGFGAFEFFLRLKLATLALLEGHLEPANATRVVGAEIGGWDTHSEQGRLEGVHDGLLREVGWGLHAMRTALSGAAANEPRGYPAIWDDTVIITMTEFGRTTYENRSFGTDHGNGGVVFVAGGNVSGGVYNCDSSKWPSGVLFDGYEGQDLAFETDYRSIMWEILRDHMGADPATVETIFPGYASLGLSELSLIG